MKKIIAKKSSVAMIVSVLSSAAYAVEPAGINLDNGILVTPLVSTGYKYDNNIFSQSSDTKSSGIFTVVPSVNLLLEDGINSYSVDLAVSSGTYLSSSDDNYLNTNLGFGVHLEPSSQNRFDITGEANWLSEPRGTGITEGLGDSVSEPLTYAEQKFGAVYEYGALSTAARVDFGVDYYNKGYTNFTDVTKFRDYDSIKLASTLYYSTGASTDVLFEISRDAIGYDEIITKETNRSSTDYRALVGVKWEATALTSGEVKLGYQEKDFDSAARSNFTGLSWDASVTWQPLTYSTIDFTTSRAARDPNVVGDYIKESLYSVSWQHNWSEKVSTQLLTSYTDEVYSGVTRSDDTTILSASVNYALLRWLDVSAFAEFTDKNSTESNIFFDKSVVGVNFVIAM